MKKLIYLLLTLSLALSLLPASYAQDTDFDALRVSDINADGIVNIIDLTFIAFHFNKTLPVDQAPNPDLNDDGIVDILDLTLVASHFGRKSGIPFEVTDSTFDRIVLGSELPIVVEFKSDSCGFCILMRPIVAAVGLEYREDFSFVKLDVNTQRQKTNEYQILGTPTYIVFKDGEIVGRFAGAMPKAELVERILGILGIEETE